MYDNWRNAPGAIVLSDGQETTRELKLLNWANDVSTVQTELRRYRDELAQVGGGGVFFLGGGECRPSCAATGTSWRRWGVAVFLCVWGGGGV